MTENEILKKLVVDEKDTIQELKSLVDKAEEFFKIEKPTGRILFKKFGMLNDSQRICIVLIGKHFAKKLGIAETDSLGVSDISKELGRPLTAMPISLKPLTDRGFVEKLSGKKYRIAYHRLSEILDFVSKYKKVGKKVK